MSQRVKNGVIVLILVLTGAFYITTIRPGHNWGDDFALYVRHAMNIAQGRAYDDSGFIYQSQVPQYSPRAYPPVLPLILSPIYNLYGLNLDAMRLVLSIFFIAVLAILYRFWRSQLPFHASVALLLMLGLNPVFYMLKDCVLSEFPFIFFIFLSLWLIEHGRTKTGPGVWGWAISTGIAMYLTYGTRSVGILLVPCFLLCAFLDKRLNRAGLVTLASCLALVIAQNVLIRSEGDYVRMFSFPLFSLWAENLREKLTVFMTLWESDLTGRAQWVTAILIVGLTLKGVVAKLHKKAQASDVFFILYSLTLLLLPLPFIDFRFYIPLLPFFFFYPLLAIEHGRQHGHMFRHIPSATLVFILFCSVVAVNYSLRYARLDFGPVQEGPLAKESQELFAFIRSTTNPDDVFFFQKPRALALFTGRKAAVSYNPGNERELWKALTRVKANYLIFDGPDYLADFIVNSSHCLKKVFANESYMVFRIEANTPQCRAGLPVK